MNKLAQSVGHENLNLKVVGSSPTFSESLGFTGSSDGKESACNAGNLGSIPGWGRSLEEGSATHSSILIWRISRTEESGWLQSMWSQSWTRLRDRGWCWVFLAAQGLSSR